MDDSPVRAGGILNCPTLFSPGLFTNCGECGSYRAGCPAVVCTLSFESTHLTFEKSLTARRSVPCRPKAHYALRSDVPEANKMYDVTGSTPSMLLDTSPGDRYSKRFLTNNRLSLSQYSSNCMTNPGNLSLSIRVAGLFNKIPHTLVY